MSTGEVDNADQLLISMYGKYSPLEISERTGVDAIQIAQRTEQALGRRDYLGEAARIQILMGKLESMADEIQGRVAEMSDRNISAAVNAASGALGRVLGQLTKIQAASKIDLDAVNKRYAQEMVRIVEKAGDRVFGELSARFPEVSADDVQQMFRERIIEVSREIDSQ